MIRAAAMAILARVHANKAIKRKLLPLELCCLRMSIIKILIMIIAEKNKKELYVGCRKNKATLHAASVQKAPRKKDLSSAPLFFRSIAPPLVHES